METPGNKRNRSSGVSGEPGRSVLPLPDRAVPGPGALGAERRVPEDRLRGDPGRSGRLQAWNGGGAGGRCVGAPAGGRLFEGRDPDSGRIGRTPGTGQAGGGLSFLPDPDRRGSDSRAAVPGGKSGIRPEKPWISAVPCPVSRGNRANRVGFRRRAEDPGPVDPAPGGGDGAGGRVSLCHRGSTGLPERQLEPAPRKTAGSLSDRAQIRRGALEPGRLRCASPSGSISWTCSSPDLRSTVAASRQGSARRRSSASTRRAASLSS